MRQEQRTAAVAAGTGVVVCTGGGSNSVATAVHTAAVAVA